MSEQSESPKLVIWTGYLAITFLLVIPLAVFMVRSGVWQQGLLLYALACLGSLLLVLLGLVLLLLPRYAAHRKAVSARMLLALPGALLLLSLGFGRGDYPPIHDVTTDTTSPPRFVAAAQQRGEGSNPLDIKPDSIKQQMQGYPGLTTLQSPLAKDAAFALASKIAADMGWEVYREDAAAGVIEAVATTGIMGFKDDVIIRVQQRGSGAAVDLRSVSRVGVGDLGANALRIEAFQEAFKAAQ